MATTEQAVRAAAFLTQALDIVLDANAAAEELSIVSTEGDLTTYAMELEASFGPAAFLIYVYTFVDPALGGTGQIPYEAAIRTLQTAAARNTPGPRLLANGESDVEGFLLATTPATYRLMAGEPEPVGDSPSDFRDAKVRADSAQAMLTHLREANAAATRWLATAGSGGGDELAFADDETELALFLLDDRSIQDLLHAVNLLISTARAAARKRE